MTNDTYIRQRGDVCSWAGYREFVPNLPPCNNPIRESRRRLFISSLIDAAYSSQGASSEKGWAESKDVSRAIIEFNTRREKVSLKTCPTCAYERISSQTYSLDSKTGEKNVPASTNSSSTITGVLLLLFGVGSTIVGILLIPAIFSLGRFEGLIAFVVGLALLWNGVKIISSKLKDKELEQIVEYTCKSCGNVWQEKHTPLKQPVYLIILPMVAGFLSCIVTASIATQFDPSKLMIMLLFAVAISCIVFYTTRQWVKKRS